jgi:hypothetical protein
MEATFSTLYIQINATGQILLDRLTVAKLAKKFPAF